MRMQSVQGWAATSHVLRSSALARLNNTTMHSTTLTGRPQEWCWAARQASSQHKPATARGLAAIPSLVSSMHRKAFAR